MSNGNYERNGRRRRSNGCLNSVGGVNCLRPCGPVWNGCCPDANGRYGSEEVQQANMNGDWEKCGDREDCCRRDRCCRDRCRRDRCRRDRCRCGDRGFGLFTATTPMAAPVNGVIPLVGGFCDDDDIPVNSGVIKLYEPGVYLATVTARVGEDTALDSIITLNVNDASQSSAVIELTGEGPMNSCAQAIFEVRDQALVTLRSSEAINITTPSAQPLFTLSLMRLEEE